MSRPVFVALACAILFALSPTAGPAQPLIDSSLFGLRRGPPQPQPRRRCWFRIPCGCIAQNTMSASKRAKRASSWRVRRVAWTKEPAADRSEHDGSGEQNGECRQSTFAGTRQTGARAGKIRPLITILPVLHHYSA